MQRIAIALAVVALGIGSWLLAQASAGEGDDTNAPRKPEAGEEAPATDDAAKTPAPAVNEKRFHAQLLAAAQVYLGYGRVDDEARWAPWLCRMPRLPRARLSASADPKTHGHKLYYLFAKDRAAYVGFDGTKPHPVGQIVVKEAWAPEPVKAEDTKPDPEKKGRDLPGSHRLREPGAEVVTDEFTSDGKQPTGPMEKPAPKGTKVKVRTPVVTLVEKDGKHYRPKARAGLFLMLKLDPETEGTDQGWVYATLTADGKTVTSAGRVAACMACHKEATHDRLFGLDRPYPGKQEAKPAEPAAGKDKPAGGK